MNRTQRQEIDFIENYIAGKLSATELVVFNQRCLVDGDFDALVDKHREMDMALELKIKENLSERIKYWQLESKIISRKNVNRVLYLSVALIAFLGFLFLQMHLYATKGNAALLKKYHAEMLTATRSLALSYPSKEIYDENLITNFERESEGYDRIHLILQELGTQKTSDAALIYALEKVITESSSDYGILAAKIQKDLHGIGRKILLFK